MYFRSVVLCILMISGVQAAQLEAVNIQQQSDRYIVSLSATVEMDQAAVFHTLSDPDRVAVLNDALVAVEHLPSDQDQGQAHIRRIREHTKMCVLFFCFDYQNTLQLQIHENTIRLDVEPANSDFEYGYIVWKIERLAEKLTRVSFISESIPSFWVPPLIGTDIMKTHMRETMLKMLNQMECENQQHGSCQEGSPVDSTLDKDT